MAPQWMVPGPSILGAKLLRYRVSIHHPCKGLIGTPWKVLVYITYIYHIQLTKCRLCILPYFELFGLFGFGGFVFFGVMMFVPFFEG